MWSDKGVADIPSVYLRNNNRVPDFFLFLRLSGALATHPRSNDLRALILVWSKTVLKLHPLLSFMRFFAHFTRFTVFHDQLFPVHENYLFVLFTFFDPKNSSSSKEQLDFPK